MIRIHVSAVCRVRDGFTGKILEGSRLQCDLDGVRCRPTAKPGGYLVLTDLPAGPHRLSLRCPGYQEEWVEFSAGRDTQELDVTMKDGTKYSIRSGLPNLSFEQIKEKFLECAEGILPEESARKIADQVQHLDSLDFIADMMRLMA